MKYLSDRNLGAMMSIAGRSSRSRPTPPCRLYDPVSYLSHISTSSSLPSTGHICSLSCKVIDSHFQTLSRVLHLNWSGLASKCQIFQNSQKPKLWNVLHHTNIPTYPSHLPSITVQLEQDIPKSDNYRTLDFNSTATGHHDTYLI
jgi:hypothetical protein